MISALRGPGRSASTVPRSQGEITEAPGLWRSARTSEGPCSSICAGGPVSSTANGVESPKCASSRSSPLALPVSEIRSESGSSSSCTLIPTTPSTAQPRSTAIRAATAGRILT